MFKKISYLSLYLVLFSIYSVNSAEVKQGVVSRGMKVKEATENTVVSSVCKQKFYGCMDSFCMLENTNGGRCVCSDRKSELDNILAEIDKIDAKSKQMATEGVENVKMGENAEEIRSRADAAVANVSKRADLKIAKEESKEKKSGLDLSIFDTDVDFDSEVDSIFDKKEKQDAEISLANKTGKALYDAVSNICKSKMQECDKDAGMLSMMYSQQIKSDCGAYENYLQQRKKKSSELLAVAEREVRTAALDKFQEENKYDPGQCVSEYSKCMIAECGEDYSKCVNVVDLEKSSTEKSSTEKSSTEKSSSQNSSSQNSSSEELEKLKIRGFEEFTILKSTFAVLEGKRATCDSVLKYCKKAAPGVWTSYLKFALPVIKSTELMIQSNRRQNCLSDVSKCFLKACKDNMDPNSKEGSYDLCLSHPETVKNQCFRELDRCGNKDDIFKLVKLRLGAMRVDACTKQVKECLTSEDRCGKDYVNCIGMDLESFKLICPVEKLVACSEEGKNVESMDKLDNMLQGIYVSIDNKLASACQARVEEIFNKECPEGNCEKLFESMKVDLEKNSPLKLDKESDGSYILSGLIDYGNLEIIKTTNNTNNTSNISIYNIDKDGYIDNIDESDNDKYKERVKLYLGKLEKSVSNVMNKFKSDPIISNCMNGRDLKQIKGTSTVKEYEKNADGSVKLDDKGNPIRSLKARGDKTGGRFPNLLDSLSSRIAKQALDVSIAVYAKAYQEKMSELVKLSPDPDKIAKALCYSMFKDSNKENWHCVKTAGLKRAKSEGKKHDNYYYPCVEYNYVGVLKTDNFDLKEEDQKNSSKYRTYIKYSNTKLDEFLKNNLIDDKSPKEILYQTKANDDETTILHETKITLGDHYNGVCEILQYNNCIYKQYDCSVNTDILSGTIRKIYFTR